MDDRKTPHPSTSSSIRGGWGLEPCRYCCAEDLGQGLHRHRPALPSTLPPAPPDPSLNRPHQSGFTSQSLLPPPATRCPRKNEPFPGDFGEESTLSDPQTSLPRVGFLSPVFCFLVFFPSIFLQLGGCQIRASTGYVQSAERICIVNVPG